MSRRALAALGAALFLAYLATASGTLPPYRDAGEFAASVHTLGVSHPPGYPVYLLLGRLASLVPLGSEAYRLNVLSALAGAGAAAAVAWAAAPVAGAWGLLAGALLGLDPTFWAVSQVPEMYSAGLLLAALCFGLALRLRSDWSERRLALLGLGYGLALGLRMDLALLAPTLLLLPFKSLEEAARRRTSIVRGLGFFALGFAVYLYLPVRAAGRPWLNWSDPSTIERFWGAITRKSYGHTLDLLSVNYAPGANFDVNIRLWVEHIWRAYGPALAFAAAGLFAFGAWGPGPLAAVAAAGPIFLYLGNMPPNPHAMAVVEPHWLTADVFLAASAAVGARLAAERWRISVWLAGLSAALVAGLAFRRSDSDRRWELLALDTADSQLRAAPKGGLLVGKNDVELFSLWHAQEVLGRRRDAVVIGQGLSGSEWYQDSVRHDFPSLKLLRLGLPENWRPFVAANGPVYATMDAEPGPELVSSSRGPAVRLSTGPAAADPRDWMELACLRGDIHYDEQKDFFSSDLVADQAAAWLRSALEAQKAGTVEEAYRRFGLAWAAKPLLPEAPLYMGLIRFQQNRAAEADRLFAASSKAFDGSLALAAEYRSLPGLAAQFAKQSATALLNWGAAEERLGRREQAERLYELAVQRDPSAAQAHYNLAVLYWNRDWARARYELEETLRLQPDNTAAAHYLSLLPKH